jgi:hypothetical protein
MRPAESDASRGDKAAALPGKTRYRGLVLGIEFRCLEFRSDPDAATFTNTDSPYRFAVPSHRIVLVFHGGSPRLSGGHRNQLSSRRGVGSAPRSAALFAMTTSASPQ